MSDTRTSTEALRARLEAIRMHITECNERIELKRVLYSEAQSYEEERDIATEIDEQIMFRRGLEQALRLMSGIGGHKRISDTRTMDLEAIRARLEAYEKLRSETLVAINELRDKLIAIAETLEGSECGVCQAMAAKAREAGEGE